MTTREHPRFAAPAPPLRISADIADPVIRTQLQNCLDDLPQIAQRVSAERGVSQREALELIVRGLREYATTAELVTRAEAAERDKCRQTAADNEYLMERYALLRRLNEESSQRAKAAWTSSELVLKIQQIQRLERDLKEAQQHVAADDTGAADLQRGLETAKTTAAEARLELEAQQQQLRESEALVRQRDDDVAALQRQFDEARYALTECQGSGKTLQAQIASLNGAYAAQKRLLDDARQHVKENEEAAERHKERADQLDVQVTALQRQVLALTTSNASHDQQLRTNLRAKESELAEARADVLKYSNMIASLQVDEAVQKERLAEQEQALAEAQERLAATVDIAAMEKSRELEEQKLRECRASIDDMTAQERSLQDTIERQRQDLLRAEALYEESKSAARDLQRELEIMRDESAVGAAELGKAQQLVAQYRRMNESDHETVQGYENRLAALRGEHDELASNLTAARKEVSERDATIAHFKGLVLELKNKLSNKRESLRRCEQNLERPLFLPKGQQQQVNREGLPVLGEPGISKHQRRRDERRALRHLVTELRTKVDAQLLVLRSIDTELTTLLQLFKPEASKPADRKDARPETFARRAHDAMIALATVLKTLRDQKTQMLRANVGCSPFRARLERINGFMHSMFGLKPPDSVDTDANEQIFEVLAELARKTGSGDQSPLAQTDGASLPPHTYEVLDEVLSPNSEALLTGDRSPTAAEMAAGQKMAEEWREAAAREKEAARVAEAARGPAPGDPRTRNKRPPVEETIRQSESKRQPEMQEQAPQASTRKRKVSSEEQPNRRAAAEPTKRVAQEPLVAEEVSRALTPPSAEQQRTLSFSQMSRQLENPPPPMEEPLSLEEWIADQEEWLADQK